MQKFSRVFFVALAFAAAFSFTSCEKEQYSVTVTINPIDAGTVGGAGSFFQGDLVDLTATPNEGYQFVGWSDALEDLSLETIYSFTMPEKDVNIVANFKLIPETIDFQSVTLNNDGYWNGSDGSGSKVIGMATFNNDYNSDWGAWSGFAFSNTTDIKDASYNNEFSAYVSSGGDAKNIYTVSYVSGDVASISFLSEVNILKAEFTNTTIAYFSMLNGDGFAKKFEKDDWFKLTVVGFDAAGAQKATVEYFLADYRNGKSFIASNWTEVDLTSLKGVAKLVFKLESTDVGDWGMNTPAYFCMDNLSFEYLK